MIDSDNLIERKNLREVVYRKEGGKRAKVRRKEKQAVKTFSMIPRPMASVYVLVYLSGLRVRPLNSLFRR